MKVRPLFSLLLAIVAIAAAQTARGQSAPDAPKKPEPPYTQTKNIVFAEIDGIGLVMDVFAPTGPSNGIGIVDIASGSFYSDRGKINDHKAAQVYDIFCGRGYTMFAVRPGSITKYTLPEMAANVKSGVAWVKEHAADYKIDPNKLGITGASAGGHLASLMAVTADEKTALAAAGVFFPPTDFLEFRGAKIDVENPTDAQMALVKRFVVPANSTTTKTADIVDKLIKMSPARQVTSKAPPFLIIHGDADPIVPLSQSEKLIEALKGANVPAELVVKKGGGHPWLTIHEEVKVMADWFDKTLAGK